MSGSDKMFSELPELPRSIMNDELRRISKFTTTTHRNEYDRTTYNNLGNEIQDTLHMMEIYQFTVCTITVFTLS